MILYVPAVGDVRVVGRVMQFTPLRFDDCVQVPVVLLHSLYRVAPCAVGGALRSILRLPGKEILDC